MVRELHPGFIGHYTRLAIRHIPCMVRNEVLLKRITDLRLYNTLSKMLWEVSEFYSLKLSE